MAGQSRVADQWVSCEVHGKRGHLSRANAKAAARAVPNERLRVYRCSVNDDLWHIGHVPEVVVRGHKSASDIYAGRDVRVEVSTDAD